MPLLPPGLQATYQRTIEFAAIRHGDQRLTNGGIPYIVHVSNVCMEVLLSWAQHPDFDLPRAVQLALLHDVLEDTPTTSLELEQTFGSEITLGVQALTKNAALPKSERMADSLRRILQQPREVALVKLADRITNLQSPPAHWDATKIAEYKAEALVIHSTLSFSNPYLAARLHSEIATYPPP